MKPNVDTLVRDIYRLMESNDIAEGVDLEKECEAFGRGVADILRKAFGPYDGRGRLRLSAIGKPDRQLFNSYHGVSGEEIRGATYIKFLYGHIVEEMLLSLVRLSGHEVSDEQKECYVGGVKGHMDGRIDGVLMDVKSCSSFGFKKFSQNTLHADDPFGYIAQLKAYAHSEGDSTYGWLAMDKQNGTLAWLQYDEDNKSANYAESISYNIAERVEDVKELVLGDLPKVCYSPVPDGKSGNMKLPMGCSYCSYKHECYPELRTFWYSTGPRYLTKVAKAPKVMEIPDEF